MMRKQWQEAKTQMGWQGAAGVMLLAVAGVLHLLVVAPLEGQTSRMQSRVDAAHAGQSAGARDEAGKFYHGMPGEQDVTDVMASIYAAADATGVKLKEASFHLEQNESHVLGYVMDLPMAGNYASIRLLVSRVLSRNPYMALDQIDFKRDQASDAELRVNVRFTLFLRRK